MPRSPVQAYRCLGCAPRCGRCLTTVRALLADARGSQCEVGCAICPGTSGERSAHRHPDNAPTWLIAAE